MEKQAWFQATCDLILNFPAAADIIGGGALAFLCCVARKCTSSDNEQTAEKLPEEVQHLVRPSRGFGNENLLLHLCACGFFTGSWKSGPRQQQARDSGPQRFRYILFRYKHRPQKRANHLHQLMLGATENAGHGSEIFKGLTGKPAKCPWDTPTIDRDCRKATAKYRSSFLKRGLPSGSHLCCKASPSRPLASAPLTYNALSTFLWWGPC